MKKIIALALVLGILFISNPAVTEAKTKAVRPSSVIEKEIDRLMSRIETLEVELARSKKDIKVEKSNPVLGAPVTPVTVECSKTTPYNPITGTRGCADEMSPTIIVVSPNGGETYYNGGSDGITVIKWRARNLGSATVNIDLISTQGLQVKNIATGVSNTGAFDWAVDSSLNPEAYKIRVSMNAKGAVISDQSDGYFALVSRETSCENGSLNKTVNQSLCVDVVGHKDLTLVWPNGGEILREGETYDIKWTGGSPQWRVRLNLVSTDMGNKPARFLSMANDGEESFTVPFNIVPDDEYYFQIERELIPQNFALNNPAFYGPHASWDYSDSVIMVKEY